MNRGTTSMVIKFACAIALSATMMVCAVTSARAASAREISADVSKTLDRFYSSVNGGRGLATKARGILVFPTVVKAGIGIGGEYGEGALGIDGRNAGYYNIASASIGLQLGVETRSIIILFMTDDALRRFRQVKGWNIGVDASVAIITVGAGGSVNVNNVTDPVLGFVLDPKGLMYNLTLEGSKVTRISR